LSFQVGAGLVLELRHGRFIPRNFQFIIHSALREAMQSELLSALQMKLINNEHKLAVLPTNRLATTMPLDGAEQR
jgi:hypothetical protein